MGLGETNEEIAGIKDLRAHGVTMLTLGQYLQPSRHHLPVKRYVPPHEFDELKEIALDLRFHACCMWPVCALILSCRSAGTGKERNNILNTIVSVFQNEH